MGFRFSNTSLHKRDIPYTAADFFKDGTVEEAKAYFRSIGVTERDLFENPAKVVLGWYSLMGVQCDPVGVEEGSVLYEVNADSVLLMELFQLRQSKWARGERVPPTEDDVLFVSGLCLNLGASQDDIVSAVFRLRQPGYDVEDGNTLNQILEGLGVFGDFQFKSP